MELKDLQGNDINQFIKNYRDGLDAQYAASVNDLQQQRKNNFSEIMAGANKAGMLYSNFPERSKLQYDTQSYYPTAIKTHQTYQTALDKLRANAIELYNKNKTIAEAIADLNKS